MGKGGLKRQLRGVKRLLARTDIQADAKGKADLELQVAELEAKIAENKQVAREKSLAVKYRKVKFFEKKKVSRKLNQIELKLKKCGGDVSGRKQLEQEKKRLKDLMTYIKFFPKNKKYVSLFAKDSSDSERLEALRKELLEEAKLRASREAATARSNADSDSDGETHGEWEKKADRGKKSPHEESSARTSSSSIANDDFFL